eukprot:s691_g4.t1
MVLLPISDEAHDCEHDSEAGDVVSRDAGDGSDDDGTDDVHDDAGDDLRMMMVVVALTAVTMCDFVVFRKHQLQLPLTTVAYLPPG